MNNAKTVEWDRLLQEALTLKGNISKIYSRFYNYSFGNQLLLMVQGVKEPVATYRRWQELGRQVKKGSKAKTVVRPVPIYDKEKEEEVYVIFKPINSVFVLSDTDGEELPPVLEVPKWNASQARSKLGVALFDFTNANGNVQGYATGNAIAINPVAKYPVHTMAHELAHVVLGHTEKASTDKKTADRGIKEFQAETVAFILMNEIEAVDNKDWNRKESRGYIQNWLKDKKPSEKEIKPIFAAVDKILKAGKL